MRHAGLKDWWPELGAAVGCVIFLGPLGLPTAIGVVLALVLYGGLQWARLVTLRQAEPEKDDPTVEELVSQLERLSMTERLRPFQNELRGLCATVRQGLQTAADEPGIDGFTRTTLKMVLSSTHDLLKLKWAPTESQPIAANYRSLVHEATGHLYSSYQKVRDQDAAQLAEQMRQSASTLRELQQQVLGGDTPT